ncbi:hypothetical protein IR083_07165 [Dysgonomonas sp. GY75]|uniref:hypothetical protein n=1 Tax=Dysgonomonas sp. GY75 TaxID=2780419 RepID=UPI001883C084|nr:hypothetical protein [Dysgonomonas sp. GY75]MBF0648594.1 hypothetical protein [Dysgonomonas sp. GY75]
MIKQGAEITIVPSGRLEEMKLSGLAGIRGIIIEDLCYNGRKNKGCMVCLDTPYMGEYTWFIPVESIKIKE